MKLLGCLFLESYRGNSYAEIMFNYIEKLARVLGYKRSEMVAWKRAKSALRLYEKMGCKQVSEKCLSGSVVQYMLS